MADEGQGLDQLPAHGLLFCSSPYRINPTGRQGGCASKPPSHSACLTPSWMVLPGTQEEVLLHSGLNSGRVQYKDAR